MCNTGLIIQNGGLLISVKHNKIQKNISAKNQKERGKVSLRKHASIISMFCLIIQILLTLVSYTKLF